MSGLEMLPLILGPKYVCLSLLGPSPTPEESWDLIRDILPMGESVVPDSFRVDLAYTGQRSNDTKRVMHAHNLIALTWAERLVKWGKFPTILAAVKANTCWSCGFQSERIDRAHIIARMDGGSDHVENIHLLCPTCHIQSEILDIEAYWRWFLATDIAGTIRERWRFMAHEHPHGYEGAGDRARAAIRALVERRLTSTPIEVSLHSVRADQPRTTPDL